MDRKEFFKSGISETGKKLYHSKIGGIVDRQLQSLVNALAPLTGGEQQPGAHPAPDATGPGDDRGHAQAASAPAPAPAHKVGFSRPPGSIRDPERFRQLCNNCGDCIVACPHGAIFRKPRTYGPILNPNMAPCHLCEDYPCIQSCEPHALLPIPEDFLPKFGHARLDPALCRNAPRPTPAPTLPAKAKKGTRGKQDKPTDCTICEDTCPIPDTLILLRGPIRLPTFAAHCAGCGLCVHACPEKALRVDWN